MKATSLCLVNMEKLGQILVKEDLEGKKKQNTTINSTELPVNCPVQSEAHT